MEESHSIQERDAPARWRRGFWSLIVTQFQGAFSDNALKALVTFIGLGMALSQKQHDALLPLIGAIFSAPFLLFSMAGGHFADRHSKRSVTIGVKVFEIGVMLLATAGLMLHSLPIGLACVFLMGTHSAIFGPSKYGLLPELLPEEKLSWGNGVLELGTFLAIISGVAAGGFLFESFKSHHELAGALLVGLAIVGLATSFGISRVPPADPGKRLRLNPLGDLAAQVRLIRRDRVLWLAVLGNIWFAFIGLMVQQTVVVLGTESLRLGEMNTSFLLVALAVGIGIGSFAAGHLSGGKIEYGLVPLGSIGLTVFCLVLARPGLSLAGVVTCLALLGFFGGFFIVPVSAIMQHRPARADKGAVLAAGNLLSFVGVFLASFVYWALTGGARLSPGAIFLISAIATAGATAYVLWLLPDALMRLVLWLFAHTVYRIRVEGRENIPEKGGALFVCNHVSFVDALLLIASTDRFVRCVMYKGIYDKPWIRPFARMLRAIPISSELRPRQMILSLREASDAIRAGEVVCIFAEGQITRTGQMLPFRRGFERIMKGLDAPIVPICLDGVWGSIFSYEKQRFFWKMPRTIPYPVTVSFGRPMPPTATPFEVRGAIQELSSEAWTLGRRTMLPIHRAFVETARQHPLRFAMADGFTPKLRYGAALTRAVFLARRLRRDWAGQEMVGILLPPSVAGALVNYAALLAGKVPVNLNYTASAEILASCAGQCGLRTVVSSRVFLEKVKVEVPGKMLDIQDVAAAPRFSELLVALAIAWLLPIGLLERALGRERRAHLDDPATVIFSSGSTGDPKGVVLSHYNVVSNVEQLAQTFAFRPSDRVLGILPFFHSFGFTGTLVAPPVLGMGAVYHPTPLDARGIGALVSRYRVTFMLATPTFLQLYLRSCAPEEFGSLAYVLAGAEKLPERLAQAFEDKFGIRPLEAYGLTECSPAVTVNTHDFRAAGFRQVGAKRGKIGHPLPGVSVRIVDPETMAPVPVGQSGLLLVRGPNVMQGYLGRPEKTAEVLKDGWYVTGDIAALDEDGFLSITDRLSRFSKIGGEMVPHVKVEERLHELAGLTAQTFVVAGVPDEKKGERLVVLHTLADEPLDEVRAKLSASDLPNLWKPRDDQFYRIGAIPYLGTGKLDLRKIKEMAIACSSRKGLPPEPAASSSPAQQGGGRVPS